MKIIHCADIHIGSAMENLTADKARVRKRELLDTFFRMIDFAKENKVRAVIIAGDFFDCRKIARPFKKEIIDKIGGAPETDFLYLRGNHDESSELEDDESFCIPQNLKKFDAPDGWRYFDYGNVCVAGIELHKQSGAGFYEKLKLEENKFNIAVLHGDLNEIRLERLRGKWINYLALGHRHIPDIEARRLDRRGEYAYSGCLEGRGFDEDGEKGFFLLSVENGKPDRKFFPFAKRQYRIVEADITGCDSHSKIESAVTAKTAALDKNDLIRVVLKGKYKAGTQKETDNLEGKLNEEFFYAQVKDESRLDMESVDFRSETSLRREFIDLVIRSGLEEEQKDRIIDCGIKALSGEEIDL